MGKRKKSYFYGKDDPKLFVNIAGKWTTLNPTSPIEINLNESSKEEIIRHLDALGRTYFNRLKHNEALFQTCHRDYVSFRSLQWALIAVTLSTFIGIYGLATNQQWPILNWVITEALFCFPLFLFLFTVRRQKLILRSALVKYLYDYHKYDPISEKLELVWRSENSSDGFEDEELILIDEYRDTIEKEIIKIIVHLAKYNLNEEENKIVDAVIDVLPNEVSHILSLTLMTKINKLKKDE